MPWPRFLAWASVIICAFNTTGFPGAIFSPSRCRTVVENLDWVLMTWGGCLSTTNELSFQDKENTISGCKRLEIKHSHDCVIICCDCMSNYTAISSSLELKEACILLYESLKQTCQAFLQCLKLFTPSVVPLHQHELLPQITIHSEQLLTPATEKVRRRMWNT